MPVENFHIGTLVHSGLELHLKGVPEEEFWSEWDKEVNATNAPIYDAYHNAPKIGDNGLDLDPMTKVARQTLQRYFHQYGYMNCYGNEYKYIGAEFQFNLPIPDTDSSFQGTFDGLMYDPRTNKMIVIEHKTFTRKPDLEQERMKPQFVLYAWAANRLFHRDVEVIYNGLAKKAGDCIRGVFTYDATELDAAEANLIQVAKDMARAARKGSLYPNRHWLECGRCNVREICDIMQRGRDPKQLIDSKYRKTEPRSTYSEENSNATDAVDVLMHVIQRS